MALKARKKGLAGLVLTATQADSHVIETHCEEITFSETEYSEVTSMFGGGRVLGQEVQSPLQVHYLMRQGLPGAALNHLVETTPFLKEEAIFEKAMGMSLRTFQRRKEAPDKPLSVEQSGRAWDFAELFAKAKAVLGAEEEAERWFETPAMALDQNSPLDLMSTPAGKQLVEDLLGRMEYGVYT